MGRIMGGIFGWLTSFFDMGGARAEFFLVYMNQDSINMQRLRAPSAWYKNAKRGCIWKQGKTAKKGVLEYMRGQGQKKREIKNHWFSLLLLPETASKPKNNNKALVFVLFFSLWRKKEKKQQPCFGVLALGNWCHRNTETPWEQSWGRVGIGGGRHLKLFMSPSFSGKSLEALFFLGRLGETISSATQHSLMCMKGTDRCLLPSAFLYIFLFHLWLYCWIVLEILFLLRIFFSRVWGWGQRVCMHSLLSTNRRVIRTHIYLQADGRYFEAPWPCVRCGKQATFSAVPCELCLFLFQACLGGLPSWPLTKARAACLSLLERKRCGCFFVC